MQERRQNVAHISLNDNLWQTTADATNLLRIQFDPKSRKSPANSPQYTNTNTNKRQDSKKNTLSKGRKKWERKEKNDLP